MGKLTAFFYILLRDYMPAGVIEDILTDLPDEFSSKPLHDIAADMASRLYVMPTSTSTVVMTGYQILNAFPATAHVIQGQADDKFMVWKENEIWTFEHLDSGDVYEYRIVKK